MYYLQSRYYDPATGRFINADSYASTGQGVLGYNMFAYCGNNPVVNYDPSGNYHMVAGVDDEWSFLDTLWQYIGASSGSSAAGIGVAVGGATTTIILSFANPNLGSSIREAVQSLTRAASEVYEYARSLIDYSVSMYENHQPRVHHVIPVGDFSSYGPATTNQLIEMRELLTSVGIDVNDPENLIVISHGSHKSLHTKNYINSIYGIMKTAKPGDMLSVRWALFLARTYASSLDQYPLGY